MNKKVNKSHIEEILGIDTLRKKDYQNGRNSNHINGDTNSNC